MKTRVVADSSCGISIEEAKKIDLEILPLVINFGKESYRDGTEMNNEQFFKKLETSADFPTTSQPPFEELVQLCKQAKANQERLYLLVLSSKISGTYQSACLAKEKVGYDEVYIIDSLATVQVFKILVLETLKLKDQMEPKALMAHLQSLRQRTKLIAAVDTLEYLWRGGRVSRSTAFLGGLLNIKPLIKIDEEGNIVAYAKKHGLNKALNALVEEFLNDSYDENYPVYFGYCKDDTGCNQLMEKVFEKCPISRYHKEDISPVSGVHVGTNASIITYVKKEEK